MSDRVRAASVEMAVRTAPIWEVVWPGSDRFGETGEEINHDHPSRSPDRVFLRFADGEKADFVRNAIRPVRPAGTKIVRVPTWVEKTIAKIVVDGGVDVVAREALQG